MSRFGARATAAASGLLLALGAAPFSFPWGVFLAVPLLARALSRANGWKAAFGIGWWCGVTFFAGSMYWIVEPFLVDPVRHGWMAPFALVLLSGGLALFWGGACALAGLAAPGAARTLALVGALTLAEYARSHVLTGFPWGLIAYSWSETPLFQLLAVTGPHGLGALTLLVAALPVLLRRWWIGAAVAMTAVAGAWSFGAQRVTAVPETGIVVRLVQPNAPQHLKWKPDWVRVFWDRALALTKRAPRPDVVIWPETSIPFLWDESPQLVARLIEAAGGAHLIAGHRRFEGLEMRNALIHVAPSGEVVANYDKHHLVPFGEYVPLSGLAARLGITGLAANDGIGFGAGPGPRLVTAPGLPPYLPLICYEAIFPEEMRAPGGRPAWIVHVTNDAWFGNFAGPFQHFVQARARAIEQGLPVARAANTGVSAMIDPYGRPLAKLPLGVEGAIDHALPAALPAPPYTWLGDWPAVALAALLLLAAPGARRFRLTR